MSSDLRISASAMTRRAVDQRTHVIFGTQLRTQLGLRLARRFRRPVDVEHKLLRTDVLCRRPVAIEAPFHQQRSLLPRQGHGVDRPMTGRAADTLVDVNAVIEVNEFGEPMDAAPFDRRAGPVALADWLEHRAADPNLLVAVHADLRS